LTEALLLLVNFLFAKFILEFRQNGDFNHWSNQIRQISKDFVFIQIIRFFRFPW
jgi:hypothetical protein